ncbi:MAG: hypothetical protein AAB344_03530 [Bacteroidota bacterium]
MKAKGKMKKAKQFLGILLAALVLQSCMEQKPVKRLEELYALKGKSALRKAWPYSFTIFFT